MTMFYQLVILCCLYIVWRLLTKKSELEPPELSGWLPIIGHGHKLLGDGVNMYQSLVEMSDECAEKGGVIAIRLGPKKIYGISDPDDCLAIMNACLQKTFVVDFFKPLLGNGLIVADAARWHVSRKLLIPAFNQKALDGLFEIYSSQAEKLVSTLSDETGKPFNHETLFKMNNLETICATFLEFHGNEHSHLIKQYVFLLPMVMQKINERVQKFWLHSDFVYNMTSAKKQLDEEIEKVTGLTKKAIQKKKIERENRNRNIEKGRSKKFLDILLDAGEEFGCYTDDQIREETDSLIAGVHDNIGSTISFALTLLGSYEEVQEKVYQEILEVCGSLDKNIDKDDLSKLDYTEAVLKETLRLYPVALVIPRVVDKVMKLKNFTIQPNTDCLIMVQSIHRNKTFWGPDVDEFRPERWLEKESLPDLKYFGAFGLGRRTCIGKAYAMMIMKINVAHVVRTYRISSDVSKMVVTFRTVTKPESGHEITLEKRHL